mgnify:CR=1 FL=1
MLHPRSLQVTPGSAGRSARETIAATAGMEWVEVAHDGWPQGLLADREGHGWRAELQGSTLTLAPVGSADLVREIQRLAPPSVCVHQVAEEDLAGWDLPIICYLLLAPGIAPLQVDVALATVALARLPHAGRVPDEGRVLRAIDCAGGVRPAMGSTGPASLDGSVPS